MISFFRFLNANNVMLRYSISREVSFLSLLHFIALALDVLGMRDWHLIQEESSQLIKWNKSFFPNANVCHLISCSGQNIARHLKKITNIERLMAVYWKTQVSYSAKEHIYVTDGMQKEDLFVIRSVSLLSNLKCCCSLTLLQTWDRTASVPKSVPRGLGG